MLMLLVIIELLSSHFRRIVHWMRTPHCLHLRLILQIIQQKIREVSLYLTKEVFEDANATKN